MPERGGFFSWLFGRESRKDALLLSEDEIESIVGKIRKEVFPPVDLKIVETIVREIQSEDVQSENISLTFLIATELRGWANLYIVKLLSEFTGIQDAFQRRGVSKEIAAEFIPGDRGLIALGNGFVTPIDLISFAYMSLRQGMDEGRRVISSTHRKDAARKNYLFSHLSRCVELLEEDQSGLTVFHYTRKNPEIKYSNLSSPRNLYYRAGQEVAQELFGAYLAVTLLELQRENPRVYMREIMRPGMHPEF